MFVFVFVFACVAAQACFYAPTGVVQGSSSGVTATTGDEATTAAAAATSTTSTGPGPTSAASSSGETTLDTSTSGAVSMTADETTTTAEPSAASVSTDSSTTTRTGDCGDHFVDPGEECDDGNRVDDDACSNACVAAVCGDGVKQTNEACDDGNRVNVDDCRDDCTIVVHRVVFVTTAKFNGNLGSLAGAYAKCQSAAVSAQLANAETFVPWLSSDVEGPDSTLDVTFTGIYELRDGTIVSKDGWAGLTDGALDHPIDQDEDGLTLLAAGPVWTATTAAGAPIAAINCSNWQSAAGVQSGIAGLSTASDLTWTQDDIDIRCDKPAHLYCFENL